MTKARARRTWLRLGVAAAVALVGASLAVPVTATRWWFTPDAIEQLAIANAWVHGAGFVDPVQWSYHLDAGPPLPGGSVRPPLLSLLLAVPLWLGSELSTVFMLHAVWSCVVAGAAVWVASGLMGLGSAAAFGLILATSSGWVFLARSPLTEATGFALYLAVLATAPGVLRSAPRALLCAALAWLAWLARPNLGALVFAVAVATAWEIGPRAASRRAAWWAHLLGFALLVTATQLAVAAATGATLYSGYDAELLGVAEASLYGRESVGSWAFVKAHAAEIADITARRVGRIERGLFLAKGGDWHWIGWLGAAGVVWALLRRRDGVVAHRLNALCALGFTLLIVLNYAGFEPRYLMLPALCAGFCGFALLDAGLRRAGAALRARGHVAWVGVLPALPVAVALLWVTLGPSAANTLRMWRHWDPEARAFLGRDPVSGPYGSLCRHMHPDALVVAQQPWQVAAICGNAGLRRPGNLLEPGVAERFLAEKSPAYFVARDGPVSDWLAQRGDLRRVALSRNLTLFEVLEPGPAAHPWSAPPPLVCAGRGEACLQRLRATGPGS